MSNQSENQLKQQKKEVIGKLQLCIECLEKDFLEEAALHFKMTQNDMDKLIAFTILNRAKNNERNESTDSGESSSLDNNLF